MKFTKESARRALRTFIQAAMAYLSVNIMVVDFTDDKAIIKSALVGLTVSSVAAGIAAVMNMEDKSNEL